MLHYFISKQNALLTSISRIQKQRLPFSLSLTHAHTITFTVITQPKIERERERESNGEREERQRRVGRERLQQRKMWRDSYEEERVTEGRQ